MDISSVTTNIVRPDAGAQSESLQAASNQQLQEQQRRENETSVAGGDEQQVRQQDTDARLGGRIDIYA